MYVVRVLSKRPDPGRARWVALAALCLLASSHAAARAAAPGELTAGQFLIASRGLLDPNFAKTVVLLIAHNDDGAMGVIINRPTEVELGQMIGELDDAEAGTRTVWVGGPVAYWQLVLLFRSEEGSDEDEPVLEDVYFSASREVLEGLLDRDMEFRIYAGYAGWSPGQLEQEIARGGWHVLPGDAAMVFDDEPLTLWQELVARGEAKWVSLPTGPPMIEAAGLPAVEPTDPPAVEPADQPALEAAGLRAGRHQPAAAAAGIPVIKAAGPPAIEAAGLRAGRQECASRVSQP